MTNEHTLVIQKTIPEFFTVADETSITKGEVLKLTDPNTASASASAADIVAGIAYTDKIANDGVTKLAVISGPGDVLIGIASGSISVGDPLITAVGPTSNYLSSGLYTANLSGSQIIGFSRETATEGETFKYVLNIGNGL